MAMMNFYCENVGFHFDAFYCISDAAFVWQVATLPCLLWEFLTHVLLIFMEDGIVIKLLYTVLAHFVKREKSCWIKYILGLKVKICKCLQIGQGGVARYTTIYSMVYCYILGMMRLNLYKMKTRLWLYIHLFAGGCYINLNVMYKLVKKWTVLYYSYFVRLYL